MIRVVFFVFSGVLLTRSSFPPYHTPLGSSVWGYFTPLMLNRPQRIQSPMEAMVDLTNSLGVAILQDHSYSRGNFAFSPYGVASVLVVMYEGARDESANQIHRAVGFPSDKDVLRMGFRDIHRHLRSYFSHEGFLSGISLNKNGSNLRPEFKKLLKYYGYDIDLNLDLADDSKGDENAKPSTQKTESTQSAGVTTLQPNAENAPLTINEDVDEKNKTADSGIGKPEESTTTEKKNIKYGDDITTTTLTTGVEETIPTTERVNANGGYASNIPTAVNLKEEEALRVTESMSAENGTTTVTSMPVTEEPTTYETTKGVEKTDFPTETLTREEMKQSTTVVPETDVTNSTESVEPGENEENGFQKRLESNEKNEKCGKEAGGTKNKILCDAEQTERETKAPTGEIETEGNKLDNGMLIPQPSEEATTTDADLAKTVVLHSATEPFGFRKGSEEESGQKSLRAEDATTTGKLLKPNRHGWEKQLRKMLDSKASIWAQEPSKKRKGLKARRGRRTIADYLKWPLNPDLSLQLQNGMYDTHVSRNAEMYRSLPRLPFLVDGAIDTPVPMMTYANVFRYGYISKLHAKALEFPLDDIRYKLLIVLPVERRGLRQLIYDLTDFSVRDVLRCLQPTRVKTVIPTFMVEGFVILTSSLQKLGIWDVFDPRKANLSGMSTDPELYVRNIEQSVTVVIRNYVEILDIQTRTMAARYLEREFKATHPFAYFVLDSATNVALMAGQMLDPLNSRIY